MSDNESYSIASISPVDGDDMVALTEEQIQHRITQIKYGKNTEGYRRWQMLSAKDPRLAESVVPPDPFDPVSKRRFDGLVKKWRRDLHMFDAKNDEERQEVEDWFMQQSVYLADVYMKQDFYPIYSHSC